MMTSGREEPIEPREPENHVAVNQRFSPSVDEALRALEREEPLTVAEEIAAEGRAGREEIRNRYHQIKQSGDTHIAELQRMSMAELIEEAARKTSPITPASRSRTWFSGF